jgi:sulfite reductase (NADPH) flavoprotein alpha-component
MPAPLLILYATVTGNAETCANSIADVARKHGYEPRVWSVDGYDVAQLASEPAVIFSVSTYGEGDPPDMAQQFYEDIQAHHGSFENLRYAIYSLGDSTYTDFCGFGKKLDTELAAKGAQPLVDRADNDLEYDAKLPEFCAAAFAALPGVMSLA